MIERSRRRLRGTALSQALERLRVEMMTRYFDDGWSVGAVGKQFRRSSALVVKYIKSEKERGRHRTGKTSSKDPRCRENRRPVSSVHCRIGVLVAMHRSRRNQSVTEFGLKVGLSRIRVAELDAGSYDLTLAELHAIAAELGKSASGIICAEPVGRSTSRRLYR
jgi:hypothetical protein